MSPRPRVLFTDGTDARVLTAVAVLARGGAACPLVLGVPSEVEARALAEGVSLSGVELVDVRLVPEREALVTALMAQSGVSEPVATRLLARPIYLGAALLGAGRIDALVAGADTPTGDVLVACELVLGRAPATPLTSSVFLIEVPASAETAERRLVFADCAVNPNPDAEALAAIAVLAADGARALLGEAPRVALLSFSSHGSATHVDAEKVAAATALVHAARPDLAVDGELQADAALDLAAAGHKLQWPRHSELAGASPVAGRANVLVFPDLDAANIGYKLVRTLARARALGVFLQGYARAGLVKLSRGATVDEIVGTTRLLAELAGRRGG